MNTRKSFLALALLSMLAIVAGCETSKPFRTGIAAGGPRIALHADAYLASDTTTDPDVKSGRASQLAQFRVVTTEPITFRPVYDAWSNVRPWFTDYSNADAALGADPTKAMLRRDLIGGLDSLVEKERARRAIWFPFDTPAKTGQ